MFYFPRSDRELWANSRTLIRNSTFFTTLFASGLREAVGAPAQAYPVETSDGELSARDSDDEADEVVNKLVTIRTSRTPPPGIKEVVIKEAAFTTYHAVLVWLHFGHITFDQLSSSPCGTSGDATTNERQAKRARLDAAATSDPELPLPASPKSVYQLAHILELPDLVKLALDNFTSQLTVENVLYQLTAEIAVHDEVRGAIVAFIKANASAVKASRAAAELSKAEVPESLGCGAEVAARFVEVFSKC